MIRAAAIAVLACALSACAGVPVGHQTSLFLGIGLVRADHSGSAVGVSSRSLGLAFGCGSLTLGFQGSYCAHIPIDGDLAIIERGSGPNQHLNVGKLPTEKTP